MTRRSLLPMSSFAMDYRNVVQSFTYAAFGVVGFTVASFQMWADFSYRQNIGTVPFLFHLAVLLLSLIQVPAQCFRCFYLSFFSLVIYSACEILSQMFVLVASMAFTRQIVHHTCVLRKIKSPSDVWFYGSGAMYVVLCWTGFGFRVVTQNNQWAILQLIGMIVVTLVLAIFTWHYQRIFSMAAAASQPELATVPQTAIDELITISRRLVFANLSVTVWCALVVVMLVKQNTSFYSLDPEVAKQFAVNIWLVIAIFLTVLAMFWSYQPIMWDKLHCCGRRVSRRKSHSPVPMFLGNHV
eukprot:TRINITY_DN2708_c0_g1_i1.p1 TRINITY_DN2708_c0_g1~~TRINITY_DN2708_c0_g1_i1.p1  ORF type:complete len:298 (+),score=12.98 TRINITY_DN2708_c0_g1_i1:201-1094(+)